jgi:hypothetical protein
VRLWDVSTQREVAVLKGHTWRVTSVCFDASGKYLASGGAMGVTCDGGGDVDSDGDCEGERDDGGDDCGEHGEVCACDRPPPSCSSSQALWTKPCACGT